MPGHWCASSRLGEINHLVNDFNEMAEKLQTLDSQRKSRNAAIAHELRNSVTIYAGFRGSSTVFHAGTRSV